MTSDTIRPEGVEYGIFTGPDIYQKILPKESIIEGMLNKGDNLVITSKAGTGKSILALQLVCNLTTGTDFLGTYHIPKPRKVLYVQTESDRAETVGRLYHMKKAMAIDDSMWAHYIVAGCMLNTQEGLNKFRASIASIPLDYDVIIIDPLYPTVYGSLSDDSVVTDWQRSMRIIRETYKKVSTIVFHHDSIKEFTDSKGNVHKKSTEDIFGSTMWGAWMSGNYKLTLTNGIHTLSAGKGSGKGRTGQGVAEIRMKLKEPSPLYYVIDEDGLTSTTDKILEVMRTDKNRMFRRAELESYVEKSKPTVCRALVDLIRNGCVERFIKEGIIYYVLADAEE